MADTVRVRGLREMQKALREVDDSIGPEIRKGLNEVAEVVLDTARPLVPTRTGKARASLKAGSSQRAVAIKAGGNKVPYWSWLDWGGRTGINKSVKRRFIPEGRYLYPSLRKRRDDIEEAFIEAMDRVTKDLR